MPYIEKKQRETLNRLTDALSEEINKLSGDDKTSFAGILNYSITRLISKIVLSQFGNLRYWHSPIIRGVLMDVSDEFYRRLIAPYENIKIKENGDVDLYGELLDKMKGK